MFPKDLSKDIIIRDFEYPNYDPRHWGRPFKIKSTFRVKVIYTFNGNSEEGELSVEADDIITVHGESGEDWYVASKSDANGSVSKGLVPKNYVELDAFDDFN